MPTLVLQPTIDSYMSGVQTGTNFGGSTQIIHGLVYSGGTKLQWRRGIVNFDVSALSGAIITSAKLVREVLSVSGAGGVGARLSRCTRPAQWTESGVTWNMYDGVNLWTVGGGDLDDDAPGKIDYSEPSATGDHEIAGLEGYIADALANRGGIVSIITRLQNETPGVTQELNWWSREGANPWRLVVDNERPAPGRRSARPDRAVQTAGVRPSAPARPAATGRPARPFGASQGRESR